MDNTKKFTGFFPSMSEATLSIYYLPMFAVLALMLVEFSQIYSSLESATSYTNYIAPNLPFTMIYYSYLLLPVLVLFPVTVSWVYRNDPFAKSIPLKATFRVSQTLIAAILLVLIFLILGGLGFLNIPLIMNSPIYLGIGNLLIIAAPNIFLIWLYRIFAYFLSPGIRKRFKTISNGQFYSGVIGGEACEVLKNFEKYPALTGREYSFLFVELHTSLRDVLGSEFPRLRVKGTDNVIVDVLISMRTNKSKELSVVALFLNNLRNLLLEVRGADRFSMANQILTLVDTTLVSLSSTDDLRKRSEISGYWNVSLLDKLKRYEVYIAIGIFVLALISSLVALHLLP